jgi:16S rRNA processing protein RimM
MDKKDFYFLGKITKTSGYKGSLVFFFDVDDIDRYTDLEAVFININDELVPFAIKNISFKSAKSAIVQLEDVTDEDAASALIGFELYLPISFLPPLDGKNFYYHEVIGFKVIDENIGELGSVKEILDQSSQAILVIGQNEKEILVPITDDIIQSVDRKNKIIRVITPTGLVDIYLKSSEN